MHKLVLIYKKPVSHFFMFFFYKFWRWNIP